MSLNFIYYVKELRSSLTSGKPSAGAIASAEDLWNITNSEKNAESVLASGSTELLIEVIKKFITISKRGNNEFRLVEACLNAVYNCTRWDVFREFFSQHPEFLSLCELLFSSEFKEFVNLAEFSVCLIAGRDESGAGRELLKRCPNIISHAVDLLDRVVMAKEYESVDNTVWDPQEQCAILLNLSISDANKPSLTIAIPVMIKALEKRPNNEGMIKTILLSFQHLSFEPITLKLLQESVPRLEKATILCKLNSENSIQLKSLMSRLKPELAKQERKASATARRPSLLQTMLGIGAKGEKNAQPQIMISYNWAHQQTVKTIHSQLVAKGFKVWIDMEQMSGNIADKMAEAVENSDVVLMCISSKYKESANCRQEAEYALECKKPLVILMMEKGYKANGWLGLMVGRKLWVDCTDSKNPDMAGILREVAGLGLGSGSNSAAPAASTTSQPTNSAAHGANLQPSPASTSVSYAPNGINTLANRARAMTVEECTTWISSSDIPEKVKTVLISKKVNGKMLLAMYTTLKACPTLVDKMRDELGCNDIMEFSMFFLELEELLISKS